MVPAPTLTLRPMSQSPRYDRCEAFERAPILAFLVSTKLPILARSPSSVPERRCANGPTSTPVARRESDATAVGLDVHVVAEIAAVEQRARVDAAADWPMRVLPSSCTLGPSRVSSPMSTSDSMRIEPGSCIDTPRSIQVRRRRLSATSSSWANCARVLMPCGLYRIAQQERADPARSVAARGLGEARDEVGQVDLALCVVRGQRRERGFEHVAADDAHAGVHLLEGELGGGRVGVLDDAQDLAVGVAHDAAVAGRIVGAERWRWSSRDQGTMLRSA